MKVTEEIGGRARVARGPNAFRIGVVLAVVVLSTLGFLSAVVLGGWADELRADDVSGEHVLSNSATGYAALLGMLQQTGVETSVLRSDNITDHGAVRVYTLPRPATSDMLDRVAGTRWQLEGGGGPVLFVLPKWRTRPMVEGGKRGWVERARFGGGLYGRRGLAGELDRYGPDFEVGRDTGIESYDYGNSFRMAAQIDTALGRGGTREVKVDSLQFLAPGWTDVKNRKVDGTTTSEADQAILDELYGAEDTSDEDGGEGEDTAVDVLEDNATNSSDLLIGPDLMLDGKAVFFSVHDEDGDLLYHVLTDPDLLNTQGLGTLTRAKLGLGIIDHMRSVNRAQTSAPVSFDLTLHGFARGSNLIKTMTRPPLLGATLCALVAALLAGWMAFGRFGDPVRVAATSYAGTGKHALIENGARLVRLARRTLGLADDYAALSRRRLLRDLRMTGEREARVDATLEGLGKTVDADIPAELDTIARAPDTGALVRAARKLHDTTDSITTDRI